MAQKSRKTRKKAVIDALNKARAMELQAIQQYMNQHYSLDDKDYGDLGAAYLATIAGTPSATGLQTQGFVAAQGGA